MSAPPTTSSAHATPSAIHRGAIVRLGAYTAAHDDAVYSAEGVERVRDFITSLGTAGAHRVLFVHGASGTGKTYALERALAAAAAADYVRRVDVDVDALSTAAGRDTALRSARVALGRVRTRRTVIVVDDYDDYDSADARGAATALGELLDALARVGRARPVGVVVVSNGRAPPSSARAVARVLELAPIEPSTLALGLLATPTGDDLRPLADCIDASTRAAIVRVAIATAPDVRRARIECALLLAERRSTTTSHDVVARDTAPSTANDDAHALLRDSSARITHGASAELLALADAAALHAIARASAHRVATTTPSDNARARAACIAELDAAAAVAAAAVDGDLAFACVAAAPGSDAPRAVPPLMGAARIGAAARAYAAHAPRDLGYAGSRADLGFALAPARVARTVVAHAQRALVAPVADGGAALAPLMRATAHDAGANDALVDEWHRRTTSVEAFERLAALRARTDEAVAAGTTRALDALGYASRRRRVELASFFAPPRALAAELSAVGAYARTRARMPELARDAALRQADVRSVQPWSEPRTKARGAADDDAARKRSAPSSRSASRARQTPSAAQSRKRARAASTMVRIE